MKGSQKWARGCWIGDKAEGIRYLSAQCRDITTMKDKAKKQAVGGLKGYDAIVIAGRPETLKEW